MVTTKNEKLESLKWIINAETDTKKIEENEMTSISYIFSPDENDENASIKTKVISSKNTKLINKGVNSRFGLSYDIEVYKHVGKKSLLESLNDSSNQWDEETLTAQSMIVVNELAPQLLTKNLSSNDWVCAPLLINGGLECYYPIEEEKQLIRQILQLCLKYKHPVSITTSSKLILRDVELLKSLQMHSLLDLNIKIGTLNDEVRKFLEPQSTPIVKRLKLIKELSSYGLEVRAIAAPILQNINDDDIMSLTKKVAENGTHKFHFEILPINETSVKQISGWLASMKQNRGPKNEYLYKQLEDSINDVNSKKDKSKVNSINEKIISLINQQIKLAKKLFMIDDTPTKLNTEMYKTKNGMQLSLF